MAIQLVGADGTTSPEVDPRFKALHVTARPADGTTYASFSLPTGALSGLTLAATVFSLRYTGSGVLLLRRLQLKFVQTASFLVAQRMEFYAYMARGWTAADSGGTGMNAASGRHRTSYPNPGYEVRIASTTALTAGTRTLDAHPFGIGAVWAGGAGAALDTELTSLDPGDHPIVLSANEGVVILNLQTMGTGGAGVMYVTAEITEASSY